MDGKVAGNCASLATDNDIEDYNRRRFQAVAEAQAQVRRRVVCRFVRRAWLKEAAPRQMQR